MQEFKIAIHYQGQWHRLQVNRLPNEQMQERWKVTGDGVDLVLTNSRPVFVRRNLKHRINNPNWKVDSGNVSYASFVELIYAEIEKRRN